MRILHIGKYYAPQRGGMERYLQDLAEWFVRQGESVGVLVHQPSGQRRSTQETRHGVAVHRVGCLGNVLFTPICPTFPLQLRRLLISWKPQLLHLHMPNPSCLAALLSPRARALPWVVHWQADISDEVPDWRLRAAYKIYRFFERALLKRAAAIVATSPQYQESSAALAEWRHKVHVVPLGTDDETPIGGTAPDWPLLDGLKLLCVGRLSYYKGHSVLLQAMAKCPRASLVIVGSGEEGSRLCEQSRTLGVSGRVSFVGELNDIDLQAAYKSADCLLLPSLDRSESFGMVLLEAMRAGLPVIASAIPGSGVNQVVQDQVTGLLLAPGDAMNLACAIEKMHSPELRQAMGAAGRERWLSEFTLEGSALRIREIYQHLAR
ncbi:MAG: glycosyltransferase [Rhodocyclaceae bacterium]|nr:MAG: glycosyltransferase [Rhodocyclaceae bacterium]